jgi:predicted RNA methylase
MVKYSCERCGKKFQNKSSYDSHNRRKTPCENKVNKITTLIEDLVEEKLIINEVTGLKRNTIDKYYTEDNVVKKCMELITANLLIDKNDICIEPSAGNGSFIKYIKYLFTNYIFYDIEPEHNEIIKQDYLDYNNNNIENYNKKHIIGNPPFGRQSSLAIKFIKKSVEFCDTISFILPKSFKKNSLKKHFPLNFHLICEYDLPKDSFIIDNKNYNVPCIFQIWIKKNEDRNIPEKAYPIKYKFVKKVDNHDISFRRVGIYAGKIDINTDDKSEQSHYFIKFDDEFTPELLKTLSEINYTSKDYTVGPKSISKQELIKEFNVFM